MSIIYNNSCTLISPDLILCSQLMYALPCCVALTDFQYSRLLAMFPDLHLSHFRVSLTNCYVPVSIYKALTSCTFPYVQISTTSHPVYSALVQFALQVL